MIQDPRRTPEIQERQVQVGCEADPGKWCKMGGECEIGWKMRPEMKPTSPEVELVNPVPFTNLSYSLQ